MSEPSPEEIAAAVPIPPANKNASTGAQGRTRAVSIHRLLPQNPDAEQGVLSAFLLSPREVGAMCAEKKFTPKHFHIPAHREVFEVLIDLHSRMKLIDFISLSAELRARKVLDQVGGAGFITSLFTFLATATNVDYYLAILQQKFIQRRVIEICERQAALAYEEMEGEQILELVDETTAELGALIYRPNERPTIREVLTEICDEVEKGKDDADLLKTGMPGIDGDLNLYRGDLLVIAAPTSGGKSVLGAQLCLWTAWQHFTRKEKERPGRVAIYPLEMRQKAVLKRALAQIGEHSPDFIRKAIQRNDPDLGLDGESKAAEMLRKMRERADDIASLDIHMRDDLNEWETIAADMLAEHAKRPFDFVLIDYLQLLDSRRKFDTTQQKLAFISKSAKALAKKLEIVLCMPSQVTITPSGGWTTREAKDPENDADSLVFIPQKEVTRDDGSKKLMPDEPIAWKQREFERCVPLRLVFNGRLVRWEAYKPTE